MGKARLYYLASFAVGLASLSFAAYCVHKATKMVTEVSA